MKERFRLNEFGKAISLDQTLFYLNSNGWRVKVDEKPIRCEGPEDDVGKPVVAFIPCDDTVRDYSLRLEDLIFLLSELEERPAVLIANDMASGRPRDATIPPSRSRLRLNEILKKHIRSGQTDQNADQYALALTELAQNAELAMDGSGTETWAIASLLDACAKMQGVYDEPRLLLWRLAEWAGISLKEPTPAKLDELYQLAVSESIESEALFDWLNANRTENSVAADRKYEPRSFHE